MKDWLLLVTLALVWTFVYSVVAVDVLRDRIARLEKIVGERPQQPEPAVPVVSPK